jgi:hypothetical protein
MSRSKVLVAAACIALIVAYFGSYVAVRHPFGKGTHIELLYGNLYPSVVCRPLFWLHRPLVGFEIWWDDVAILASFSPTEPLGQYFAD